MRCLREDCGGRIDATGTCDLCGARWGSELEPAFNFRLPLGAVVRLLTRRDGAPTDELGEHDVRAAAAARRRS